MTGSSRRNTQRTCKFQAMEKDQNFCFSSVNLESLESCDMRLKRKVPRRVHHTAAKMLITICRGDRTGSQSNAAMMIDKWVREPDASYSFSERCGHPCSKKKPHCSPIVMQANLPGRASECVRPPTAAKTRHVTLSPRTEPSEGAGSELAPRLYVLKLRHVSADEIGSAEPAKATERSRRGPEGACVGSCRGRIRDCKTSTMLSAKLS
mmetsp:Transcript_19880/g.46523  ORF Transcript_19880/g.46523 Transcript_19880/m.46523 type:complete len:208 (-) Transcript_19880:8-631(-)